MNFEFFSWKKKMSENVGKLQVFAIREREKIKKKSFLSTQNGDLHLFYRQVFLIIRNCKENKTRRLRINKIRRQNLDVIRRFEGIG